MRFDLPVADHREILRCLTLGDERFIESVLGAPTVDEESSLLDPKTHALVRIGSQVALGAEGVSYHSSVEAALAAGASMDEIVGTLIAVAPEVGLCHVIAAAPRVALALGYDVDEALETLDPPGGPDRPGSSK